MNITDIHTHILFDVDDGARDIETSIELLKMAYADGTRTVFLTPHSKNGGFDFERANKHINELVRALPEPAPKLYAGCEIFYSSSVCEQLKNGKLPTLAGSRYVLCEFMPNEPQSEILSAVRNLCKSGFYPIVAHAERYMELTADGVREIVDSGGYIQLNARSVCGANGFKLKHHCAKLIKNSLVHFIASDAHSLSRRTPVLSGAAQYVTKKFGSDIAAEIFYKNPAQIISNTII